MKTTAPTFRKFSYDIEFRYKKFDENLNLSNFIKSVLTITLDEPVPEPMQKNWRSIIHELNPNYYQIEVVDVKAKK